MKKPFILFPHAASVIIAAAIIAACHAQAEDMPDWQGRDSWFGFKLYGAMLSAGGLSFKWAEVQGKSPHLFRDSEFAATLSQHNFEIPYWSRYRMGPLGHFGTGAPNENEHAAVENSWSHCVISYPSYKIHVSRLTPAVLLETAGDCVVFSNEIPNIKLERGLNYNPQPAFPRFMAWLPDGDKATQTAAIAGNDEISLGGALQEVYWALLWYGKVFDSHTYPLSWSFNWGASGGKCQGDMPVLLVFSQPIESIEISESNQSLAFFFPEDGVKAAMVLPWERFFQLVDTSAWLGEPKPFEDDPSLPPEVTARCLAWAERLQQFPIGVRESFRKEADGAMTLREEFEFLPLNEDAKNETPWAPVPPTWIVAADEGFPLAFNAEIMDTEVYTYAGPYRLVKGDSFEANLPDLGKYWRETRFVKSLSGPDPAWAGGVEAELEKEIASVLDAGHLAPWLWTPYKMVGRMMWNNSGETLYSLSQAADVLPEDLRAKTLAYLQAEDAAYPVESGKWLLKYSEGARREGGQLIAPDTLRAWTDYFESSGVHYNEYLRYDYVSGDFLVRNNMSPAENLYYLAEFFRMLPDRGAAALERRWPAIRKIIYPHLCRLDWATGSFFAEKLPLMPQWAPYAEGPCSAADMNKWFAAAVGLARLAQTVGDQESVALAEHLLARAALTRHAQSFMVRNLYRHGLQQLPAPDAAAKLYAGVTGNTFEQLYGVRAFQWRNSEDDIRQVVRMDEFQTLLDVSLTISHVRSIFAFQGMVPETGRFMADFAMAPCASFLAAMDTMPDWYVTRGEDLFGREQGFDLPECSRQMFMAKLWIAGAAAEQTAKYLDVPWVKVGDYFQIQKLTELLRAARGCDWTAAY